MAIEPKTKADREKMGESLGRLVEEDPTLTVKTNEETGQTIIAGMGELHLDIIMDRMRREFNVETNAGAPQIAYRETITKDERRRRQARQAVGRPRPIRPRRRRHDRPAERGKGIAIENKVVGGNIPKEYIPACKKGIEEALLNGVVNGSPVIDVAINITDGSYHEVDSNELAFKLAAIFAVRTR
jgi:elongation factor G